MMGEGSKPTSWADRWSVLAKENETLYKQLAAVRELLPGQWWWTRDGMVTEKELIDVIGPTEGPYVDPDQLKAALNGKLKT